MEVLDVSNNYNSNVLEYKKDIYNKNQTIALFLQAMSHKPSSVGKTNDDYSRSMYYEYNILDIPSFHLEMINYGYFARASFESTINSFKSSDLKNMLIEKQYEVKGLKKEEMIEAILNVFNEEEKRKVVDEQNLFEISSFGREYLVKYKEFLEVVDFKEYQISFPMYLEYKRKLSSNLTVRDIVWHILNERTMYYLSNKKFGYYRNNYHDMAKFLEKENPSSKVLFNYLACLYIDINLGDYQTLLMEHINNKKFLLDLELDNSHDPLAPAIVSKVKEYSTYHDEEIYEKIFKSVTLPFKFITNEDFKKMVTDIYTSTSFDESKYVKMVNEKVKNMIHNL